MAVGRLGATGITAPGEIPGVWICCGRAQAAAQPELPLHPPTPPAPAGSSSQPREEQLTPSRAHGILWMFVLLIVLRLSLCTRVLLRKITALKNSDPLLRAAAVEITALQCNPLVQ